MSPRLLLAALVLFSAGSVPAPAKAPYARRYAPLGQDAPPAAEYTRLDGCTYLPQPWNDGDSFHVRSAAGEEFIFRLYFVDTPESENSFPARVAEQADYFGIGSEQALKVGKDAAKFTAAALGNGVKFTVFTRKEDAMGRSQLPRFFAFVKVGPDYLQDLLVKNGLARIYGKRTPLPDGQDSRAYLAHLAELEGAAKAAKRGAWSRG